MLPGAGLAFQQGEAGGLADREAGARGIAGPAGIGRDQLERRETAQGQAAQRVRAAHHGGVRRPALDQVPGVHEGASGGGAGGGERHRRPGEAERGAHEAGQGEQVVRVRVVEIGRQRAGLRVAAAIGFLARQHARRAGADHDRDPARPVPRLAAATASAKPSLPQRHVGQAVVAAIELREAGRQRMRLHPVDPADMAEPHLGEIAGTQPAARAATRRSERGIEPAPHGADHGEPGEKERSHRTATRSLAGEQEGEDHGRERADHDGQPHLVQQRRAAEAEQAEGEEGHGVAGDEGAQRARALLGVELRAGEEQRVVEPDPGHELQRDDVDEREPLAQPR